MKEIINEYKEKIKELLNNKQYIFSLIIVAILGYGYFITHVTIGMDDTCLDRYYGEFFAENMISAGRWGSFLIYRLLNIVKFTPFWLEFITIITIIATAILISSFIRKNIKKSSIGLCIVFSCLYISYSIYNEALIFQPSNFALFLSNLLTILSVIVIYEIITNNLKKKYYLTLFLILAISISMYEACCQTFLVAMAICLLIRIFIYKESDKNLYKYFAISIGILITSIILNYVILYVFYFIGIPNTLQGGRTIYWFSYGLKEGISIMANSIIYYAIRNIKYFPVLEFVVCTILGLILSIYYSIKNKNSNIFNIYILMYIANIALAIIQCRPIMYRASTSWGLFVATIITFIYVLLASKKCLHKIAIILVTLIILWQTRDLNQWFYSEYVKYQKDLKMAYQIAEDIQENADDLRKPVVFIGTLESGFWINGQAGAQSNGLSVLWWGQNAFEENAVELIKFINSLGYNFRIPTDEQCEEAERLSKEMNNYPKNGYVKEFEDIIIVKFNSNIN